MIKTIQPLKAITGIVLAMVFGGMLVSCGEETEGRIDINDTPPSKITDVKSMEGPGEVRLEWTIPSDASFMYTRVEYINGKGEEKVLYYSKDRADENGVMHVTIQGFANTSPVEFQFYACSVRGKSRDAVTYSATPGAPAFLAVAQSVAAEPAWGGINVSYSNPTDAEVIIKVLYHLKSDASKKGEASFTAKGNTSAKNFVALSISDTEFINGDEAVLEITAQDSEGNAAEPRSAEVRTKKVAPIDRTNWSVPGFTDTYDAQIGYSSQEAGGEGAFPNGRIVAMFDGNENTFWHTAWKQSSSYPHFFIVDMGKENLVTNVSIRRRTNNNGTNIGQTIYTCSEAAATGANPSAWSWINQGWNSFDRNSNRHQLYGMSQAENARYIKVYYAESDKGGNFVMVSEFNAYTPAE